MYQGPAHLLLVDKALVRVRSAGRDRRGRGDPVTARTYENFDLTLAQVGEGRYRATVAASPCGDSVEAEFALPFDTTRLENLLLRLDPGRSGVRRASTDPREEAALQLGEGLFQAVFGGAVGDVWARNRDVVHAEGKGLRLRLQLDRAPDIAGLPWELLHDHRTNTYLAQSDRTPVVRFLDVPQAMRPLVVGGALHILVVISAPTDLADLDVDAEWAGMQEALADRVANGSVVIDRLPEASLTELSRWLRRHTVHVLHVVGHGEFDRTRETGVLYFCDRFGRTVPVTASVLGPYIYDHDPLRLVVLNACRTSSGDTEDPFSGLAQGLVQQNSSAVVAMQFPISDRAAVTFTSEFYGGVADGYPVDQAVTYARKALLARFGSEWATPTVFTQAADGMVFDQIRALPTTVPETGSPQGDSPEEEHPAADGRAETSVPVAPPPVTPEPDPAADTARAVGPVDSAAGVDADSAGAGDELAATDPATTSELHHVEPSDDESDEHVSTRRRTRVLASSAALVGLVAAGGLWWAVAKGDPEPSKTSAPTQAVVTPSTPPEQAPTRPFEGGPRLEAVYMKTPVVDGVLGGWPAMNPVTSEMVVRKEGRQRQVDGRWRLGWNDDNLLVFVEVFDRVLTQTHADEPALAGRGDSVGIDFGPAHDDVRTDILDPADRLVIIGPTESGGVVAAAVEPDGDHFPEVAARTGDEVGDIAVRTVDNGYIVEAAIPWGVLGVADPRAESVYAMNLLLSDAIPDGERRGELLTLQSNNGKLATNTVQHRHLWGTVELLQP